MNEPVHHQFETPAPIRLYVENGGGSVTLTAVDAGRTDVRIVGRHAADVAVTQSGDQVSVIAPRARAGFLGGDQLLEMVIELPASSSVTVKAGSADVIATGFLEGAAVKSGSGDVVLDVLGGAVVVDTGSGDVRISEVADDLRVRSGSGDVLVGLTRASASVSTGSGDVHLDQSDGPVVVKTGSGDLEIADAHGDVAMTTGSGDTVIRVARSGRITSKAASGDVRIGIPSGTPVWTDITTVSGRVSSSVEGVGEPAEGAPYVELRATTVSGDIALTSA